MGIRELLESRRKENLDLAARYGAKIIRVFGSVARREGGPESDLDFLVDMEKGRNLLDLVGFWQDLEEFAWLSCGCDYGGRDQPLPSRADLCGGATLVKEDRIYLLHIRDALERILA